MTAIMENVYNFIQTFTVGHGYPPTLDEIAAGCGLGSKSHVHYFLVQLRDAGRVTWQPNSPRTLRVIGVERSCSSSTATPQIGAHDPAADVAATPQGDGSP